MERFLLIWHVFLLMKLKRTFTILQLGSYPWTQSVWDMIIKMNLLWWEISFYFFSKPKVKHDIGGCIPHSTGIKYLKKLGVSIASFMTDIFESPIPFEWLYCRPKVSLNTSRNSSEGLNTFEQFVRVQTGRNLRIGHIMNERI